MSTAFYLAGPMSGKPDHNYAAFTEAAAHFRGRNMLIKSPHELHNGDKTKPYGFYMRAGLQLMLECDAIILLPGWQASRGARTEEHVAHMCNMWIFHVGHTSMKLIPARGRGNQDVTTFRG